MQGYGKHSKWPPLHKKELKTERFKRFAEHFGFKYDPIEFSNHYLKHLSEAGLIFSESRPLIEHLSRDYRLAIVTNGLSIVQRGRMARSELNPYFEDLFISEELGVSKPNPEIFF